MRLIYNAFYVPLAPLPEATTPNPQNHALQVSNHLFRIPWGVPTINYIQDLLFQENAARANHRHHILELRSCCEHL